MNILLFVFLLFVAVNASAGTSHFVSCTGNDANTGLSDAQAWKTPSKVNSNAFSTGDDVYFKWDCQWDDDGVNPQMTALTIDWSGTSGDRVVIGSYYGSGTIGTTGTGTAPTFVGTFHGINQLTDLQSGSAIPPNTIYSALIQISNESTAQDYVTIENFILKDSAGRGIHSWHSGNDNIIIQNNTIQHTASACIAVKGSLALIAGNDVSQCDATDLYDSLLGTSLYTDGQPCIYLKGTKSVTENNYAHECQWEGIGSYHNTGSNIMRGNTVVAARRVGIYLADSNNNIAERNKVIGHRVTTTVGDQNTPVDYFYSWGWPGVALASISEGDGDATNNHFRNNLVSNHGHCMQVAYQSPDTAQGYFYNNTCAGNNHASGKTGPNGATIHAKNNIFIYGADQGTSTECNWSTDANQVFDYNYFEAQPVDPDCRGAGDVYGGLALTKTTGWTSVGLSDIPSDDSYRVANTTVDNWGVQLNTTVHTTANYGVALLADTTLDLEENETDFLAGARDATPDMGAYEGATSPPPTEETAPYIENVGGSGFVGAVLTYTVDKYCTGPSTWVYDVATAVAGTTDDEAYQYVRGVPSGNTLTCDVPIANGTYDVIVGYNEVLSCYDRKFDLAIEGASKEDELHICGEAGGTNIALIKTYGDIVVADGSMTLIFSPGTTGAYSGAVVAAIHITTPSLSVGNPTKSVTVNNDYSSTSSIDAITQCDVTSDNAITITGVTQPTSGTVSIAGDSLTINYLPTSAEFSGSAGTTTVTFDDTVSTDTCVITITVSGLPYVRFQPIFKGVKFPSTTNWDWEIIESDGAIATATKFGGTATDETIDSAGYMLIPVTGMVGYTCGSFKCVKVRLFKSGVTNGHRDLSGVFEAVVH